MAWIHRDQSFGEGLDRAGQGQSGGMWNGMNVLEHMPGSGGCDKVSVLILQSFELICTRESKDYPLQTPAILFMESMLF